MERTATLHDDAIFFASSLFIIAAALAFAVLLDERLEISGWLRASPRSPGKSFSESGESKSESERESESEKRWAGRERRGEQRSQVSGETEGGRKGGREEGREGEKWGKIPISHQRRSR